MTARKQRDKRVSEPRASEMAKGRTVIDGATGPADGPSPQPSSFAAPPQPQWEPQERQPDTSLVGRTVGSYRVIGLLGEGGVGAVYLGEHPLVQSRVAIKVLHDDYARSADMVHRFVTEARAANLIQSPHVVPVSDFGQLDDGRQYSVMEYLEGRSLGAIVETEGRLDTRRVLELLRQTAEGMAVAHAHGIIHRDLKPENLFVERHPKHGEFVRILDFGVAKLTSGRDPKLTAAGAFVGTPLYSAPEQAAGKPVGPACDIYALGAVAFELLTGEPLFDGDCMDVLRQKAHGAVEALRKLPGDLPPELARLIGEMLEDQPAARPQSMTDVAQRLSAIELALQAPAASAAPAAMPASIPVGAQSAPRAPWLTRRVISATLLGLVVAAVAIWIALPDEAAPSESVETRAPAPAATTAVQKAHAPPARTADAPPAAQAAGERAPALEETEAAAVSKTAGASAQTPHPDDAASASASGGKGARAATGKGRAERLAPGATRARSLPKSEPGDKRGRAPQRSGRAAQPEPLGTLVDPFSH